MNAADNAECILLIESNPEVANLVRSALTVAKDGPFAVEWMDSLQNGLVQLSKGGVKAVLLNLHLSDSQGMDTFDKLFLIESRIPILILSDNDHEEIARLTLQRGADDYLLTGHIDTYNLSRAIRNALERKATQDALFMEKERAQVTLNSIGDGVISTDISGNVSFLNIVAERMTGWTQAEAKGQPFSDVFNIIDSDTRESLPNPLKLAIQESRTVGISKNSVLVRRDGAEIFIDDSAAPILDRNGHIYGGVIVFHDVSDARSMMMKMSHLAEHDFLTDLPNRLLLNDRIIQSISLARRHNKKLALLFIDLDHFKNINDSLGHLIGDKLLQSVAHRLKTCVRDSDTVSRQGGDEFVVLLSDIEHDNAAGLSAAKILSALEKNYSIDEHDLTVTMSIGISIYPADGEDGETLLKNADAAMYHAKEKGRNNYQFFKKEMNDRAVERQSLESNFRAALQRNEFFLHYQPKVNLITGNITGAEALIRWQHPQRGILYPRQFITIAEDSGLIVPMGLWVLHEACSQARAWQDAGLLPIPIAVNISAVEFRRVDFIENIRAILKDTGLDSKYLEIELTESVLMKDIELTLTALHSLKDMGIQLAIDDFGTGYSSLSYLRQFPIDTLKIDQSFVRDIATIESDATIVSAVIGMGNNLKLKVTAEGVETKEQLEFLLEKNCTEGQGFYFSLPVDAEAFSNLHDSTKSHHRGHWASALSQDSSAERK